ncbi:MAG: hypothetical protein O3B13_13420 [Planctomycetota bacterium]|nr:hypothetical protein [Planctomycetota bacterium]
MEERPGVAARPQRPVSTEKIDGRMLAAVVPAGGQGWFFKISGAAEAVAAEEEKFATLLKTLRIEDGRPVWTTPVGWTETAGSGMRAATFTMGADDAPLECSVIALPAEDASSDDYLHSNINRWRGQLGLEPQTVAALKESDEFHQFELADKTTITWVNLAGQVAAPVGTASPTASAAPSAPGPSLPPGHPPVGAVAESRPEPDKGKSEAQASLSEMSFAVPEGWVPGPLRPFRKISWNIDHEGKTAEFYISSLAAAGSEVGPNVNRWRTQAGLKALSEKELADEVEDISIDGEAGQFVRISGEKQSIIGAIVVKGDTGWFFKLVGDPAVVSDEKDNVKAFIKSVRFFR